MSRILKRWLSSRPGDTSSTGCRVLDYATPSTHFSVARPRYLLSSRTGNRYQNSTSYEERAELVTIVELLKRKRSQSGRIPAQWPALRQRLGLDPHAPFGDLQFAQHQLVPPTPHINLWVDCLEAPNLTSALEIINSHRHIPWPPFVILFTLGRHARSALEAYNAIRLYQNLLPEMPSHIQPELVTLAIKLAQKHVLDLIPQIVQTYLSALASAHQEMNPLVMNELLWQIARYGKNWSPIDTYILAEAQEIVVKTVGSDSIDLKGMFALSYVSHFTKPLLSRKFMEEMSAVAISRTPASNAREFAYTNGPAVIKLLTSQTAEEALSIVDATQTHKPAMWSCVALFLSRNKLLTADIAMRLWKRAISHGVRITGLLTELVLGSVMSLTAKHKVLSQALTLGIKLTPSLVAKMAKVASKSDLHEFQSRYAKFLNNPLVREQMLMTQSLHDPGMVWSTYTSMYGNKDAIKLSPSPSRKALRALCTSAWDRNLVWDGLYASQRALAEFRSHVRGIVAPADDLLRIYPDEQLIYAYVVMAGRSGYHSELIYFLEWMRNIDFEPSKRILLALIHYSPQGPALLKLGQKTRPPASNWPTEEEYELYRTGL